MIYTAVECGEVGAVVAKESIGGTGVDVATERAGIEDVWS